MTLKTIAKAFFKREYQMIGLYRIRRLLVLTRNPVALAISSALGLVELVWTNCQLSPYSELGNNLQFPHPIGIVIGQGVVVGNDVKIWQNVTLGSHGRPGQRLEYPVIGHSTHIYAGAVIVGGLNVGEGARIGANSVVTRDVPPHSTVGGVPAKLLNTSDSTP